MVFPICFGQIKNVRAVSSWYGNRYDQSSNVSLGHISTTVIYNKQSKWDASIEAANKALEIMGEVDTKDAKVHFEMGNSYYGKGDNTAACEAYGKANKGDYAEAAKYQMEHVVKCN